MHLVEKIYYNLTAYVPRPMPENELDIMRLKEIFTQAFGLEDTPQVWYTIFANIAATKATSTSIYYGSLANIARRLNINKLLQDHKQLEQKTHTDMLEQELQTKLVEEAGNGDFTATEVSDGSPDIQRDVQELSKPSEPVVQLPN